MNNDVNVAVEAIAECRRLVREGLEASQLRAYGNAIVPHVAAEFIGAFMSASQRTYV